MKKILCFIGMLCCIAAYTFAQDSKDVIPLLNAYDFLFFNRTNDQYSNSNNRTALFKEAQATASAIQNNAALQQNYKPLYTRYYAEYYYLATLIQLDNKNKPLTQVLPVLDTAINWYKGNVYVDVDSTTMDKLKAAAGVREASVTYDNSELYSTLMIKYDSLVSRYNSLLLDTLRDELQKYTATNHFDAVTTDKAFTQYQLYNEPISSVNYLDSTSKAIFKIHTYFRVLQASASHNCDSLLYYFALYKALQRTVYDEMDNMPALKDTVMNCNRKAAYRKQIETAAYRKYMPDEDATMPPPPPPPPAPVASTNERGAGAYNMPAFPWPPPTPSSRSQPLQFKSPNIHTLEDANQQLLSALSKANYNPPAYYYVPGGFALVTPLEQLQTDGKPKGDPPRWNVKVQLSDEFSFMNYLKALFVGLKGYYRVMAFVVTDQPLSFTQSATASQVLNIEGGIDRLPIEIGYKPFTSNHRCTVLIYEFEKQDNSNVTNFIQPGRYSVQTHLQQTQVWQKLF